MADEFTRLWETVTRDPGDMAFLPLGEHLRRRGELESAARVAVNGLEKHPHLAAGHDLYARILTDMGDFEAAGEEWEQALEAEPQHTGAQKGLGFVRFREGNLYEALEYLENALATDPTDQTIVRALYAVRAAVDEATPAPQESEPNAITSEETVFAAPSRALAAGHSIRTSSVTWRRVSRRRGPTPAIETQALRGVRWARWLRLTT